MELLTVAGSNMQPKTLKRSLPKEKAHENKIQLIWKKDKFPVRFSNINKTVRKYYELKNPFHLYHLSLYNREI